MMKVKEFKEHLKGLDDEMEIYVYADHGQQLISLSGVSTSYVAEMGGELEELHKDDLEEFEADEYSTVLVMEGM